MMGVKFGAMCILVAAALPLEAALACEAPVFACEIAATGKQVQVCQHGDSLHYAFGPKGGAAELRLQKPLRQVQITPWNGMGERYWSSLEMRNGVWSYRMAVSYARGALADEGQASLTVLRNGEQVRVWHCRPESVRERIESVLPL